VFHETVKGHFWHIRYDIVDPRPGEPASVTVATTRPETLLGDTAVAVHPAPARALAEAEQARARVQGLPVSARDLLELERMGTSTAMLDFVVAASYPEDFAIGGGATGPAVAEARQESAVIERRVPLFFGGGTAMSYFDWAMWNGCRSGWGMMDPIGCGWFPMLNVTGGIYSPYARFGAAWPYGGWYGNPYGGGIVIRPIVVPGDGGGSGGGGSAGGGRMVRGRGYVRDGDDGGSAAPRSAQPRGGSVRTESSSGSSSGSMGSGGGGGGGGGGSSAPRTAKPRDP